MRLLFPVGKKTMRICSTCYWRWYLVVLGGFSPHCLGSFPRCLASPGKALGSIPEWSDERFLLKGKVVKWTFFQASGRRSKWFGKGSPVSHADELGLFFMNWVLFYALGLFLMFLKGKTSIHKVRYLFCDSQMNSFEVSSIHSWNFNTTAIKACMQQLGSLKKPRTLFVQWSGFTCPLKEDSP